MARLGSDLKMGYYPTPWEGLQRIIRFLNIKNSKEPVKIYILDPCCGEGEALQYVWNHLYIYTENSVKTYGIELDSERFMKASEVLDYTVHGSIFDAKIDPLGCFGLLWLNPPYAGEDGERTEMKFLRHSVRWLCDGGVLVFIVQESLFGNQRVRSWISMNFQKVRIFRFPEEEFPRFKQVVLFGIKGRGGEDIPTPPYSHIPFLSDYVYPKEEIEGARYEIPSTSGPEVFQSGRGVTPEEIEKFRPHLIEELRKISGSQNGFRLRPLLPLRKGHLVALLTAGMLDGKIDTPEGGFILVKGFSDRVTTTWVDEDSGKEITKNTYSVGIRVMEQGGKWYDIR